MHTAAIHLYNEKNSKATIKKIGLLLVNAKRILLGSRDGQLNTEIKNYLAERHPAIAVTSYLTGNDYNDWSSYLKFLAVHDGNGPLLICNDSIANRRILSPQSILKYKKYLSVCTNGLIGELDSNHGSVTLNGQSSVSWISSYLFIVSGQWAKASQLETDMNHVLYTLQSHHSPDNFLKNYVRSNRPDMANNNAMMNSKLSAMVLERLLTMQAITQGAEITSIYYGSTIRKLEKWMEQRFKRRQ